MRNCIYLIVIYLCFLIPSILARQNEKKICLTYITGACSFFFGNILKVVLLIGVLMVHHLTLNLALDNICRPTLTDSLDFRDPLIHEFTFTTN